ncbi:hypothetical protein Vadar_029625 [Vaccinium darrowii]|uniref:Uncharacterized protein n=1 Tax=Vaccinium darrowii TaxID=229202 RepID=A0ACB7Z0B8_9ERIC|nr:hypothetical protein Vadar_029625 [Vaccinium darrowii]
MSFWGPTSMTWNQKYPPNLLAILPQFHCICISNFTASSSQLKNLHQPLKREEISQSHIAILNQMAASSVMQSILVSPVTGVAKGLGSRRMIPCCYLPRQQRNSTLLVRCMAEDGRKEDVGPTTTSPPSTKAKVSTNFFDVFAFSGPAPERINGRLAMIGFVTAIAIELAKGEDVFAQISDGGIPWFLYVSGVLSAASLIPMFSGVSVESKSKGFFNSDAELWNGRFAMVGLVALAVTELVKGGALV